MPSDRSRISLKNLSIQLSLIAIGIPTIVLILFEFYHVQTQTVSLEKDLDIFLKNEVVQLSASLSSALFNLDSPACEMICRAALAKQQILKITIWDNDREYLSFQDDRVTPEYIEKGFKHIEYPISFEQEKIGKIKIIVTTVLLAQKIEDLKFNSFLQLVVVDLILGLVLFVVLMARFVAPLRELKKSSEKIAAGDLDHPINVHRNDEFGALADNMIIMRDSVKEKVESLEAEVHQHQKTAVALEKSESFLRLIIDLIPHMIFVKNIKGEFLVVNQAMAENLGSTVDQVIGRRHIDLVQNKDQARQMIKDDQRVMLSKKTLSVLSESHGTTPNSSTWFSTKKVPFTATDGDVGVVGITIDISDLKQAELELKTAKNYIDNIINSMPSALFSLDRNFVIVLWNHRAEDLYGIFSSEAISKPLEEVLPQMEPYMEKIRSSIENQSPHYFSKQVRQRFEELIYEDITVYPLAAGVEGAVIRVDDVTEQVRMEEMVVQSEKMLSVGGLAAGMAHEINNPLAGMMQNAQVILQRIQGDIPASIKLAEEMGMSMDQIREFMDKREITRQLELIREAGVRASQIVQNMLSFSRKEFSGKVRQDIAQILDKTIELAKSDYDLKKQYDFKKIKIIREYDPRTPQVMCEPSKVQQVFFNILKNSAEAMQEPESSTTPQFDLRVFQKGDHVCIEIEDNGPGMKEGVRKRIFEPFFTTKSVGRGTGLGLSVSYFIITDNHNGEMTVVSKPGKGSKFIILLPVI